MTDTTDPICGWWISKLCIPHSPCMEYLLTFMLQDSPSFVGKYTSIMVRIWVWLVWITVLNYLRFGTVNCQSPERSWETPNYSSLCLSENRVDMGRPRSYGSLSLYSLIWQCLGINTTLRHTPMDEWLHNANNYEIIKYYKHILSVPLDTKQLVIS